MKTTLAALLLATAAPAAPRADHPAQTPENKPAPRDGKPAPKAVAVAVVVHCDNPVTNLTSDELRSLLQLDRQFWDDKQRVVLIARPAGTPEQELLLAHVYGMDDKALHKYWVGKLYAGKIPAIPTVAKTATAATKALKQSVGALTVVLASEVAEGVKVVTIDGKKPGEAGYPLVTRE